MIRRSGFLPRFMQDEGGMISHFALVVVILVILFAGMSLDTTNALRMRMVLQTAADTGARAAIRELPSQNNALEAALELANANLTSDSQNVAVTADTVTFGHWDEDSETFTATTSNPNAVRVIAQRSSANSNPLPTFLLRFAGVQSWNIEVSSIGYRKQECQIADIATNGTFSITSNNEFYSSFCVSAADVDLNNNNYFDDDNRIYVPSFSNIGFNGSTSMSTIVGRGTDDSSATLTYADIFEENADLTPTYVSDVDALGDLYLDPDYALQPDWINTSSSVITIDASDVKYTNFIPGRIYEVECGGGKGSKAQFFNGAVVSEIVMVSECKIQIGKGSELEDVVLVSRDTSNKSVYAASQVRLGADDDCAEGGGVQIYAAGDFTSASQLEAYGATISTVGGTQIAAQSDGIAGLNIQANGDVSFSAQVSLGTCKSSEDTDALDVAYSLVQ